MRVMKKYEKKEIKKKIDESPSTHGIIGINLQNLHNDDNPAQKGSMRKGNVTHSQQPAA